MENGNGTVTKGGNSKLGQDMNNEPMKGVEWRIGNGTVTKEVLKLGQVMNNEPMKGAEWRMENWEWDSHKRRS